MRLRRLANCVLLGAATALLAVSPVSTLGSAAGCEQLRIPSASIEHVMVHVTTFHGVYEQAKLLMSHWQLPAFKETVVTQQLLGAMADMALHDTSEAMINVTVDHTLTYTVAFNTASNDNDRNLGEQDIRFTPEQSVDETVVAFCGLHNLSRSDCDVLQPQLIDFVVRDWGCATSEDSDPNTSNATTHSPVELQNGVASTPHLPALTTATNQQQQQPPPLPVLQVNVNGSGILLTLRDDQDLELQSTVLCHKWKTPLEDCKALLTAMRNVTKDHPAFTNTSSHVSHGGQDENTSTPSLEPRITSPVSSRLYPINQRVYVDGAWWNQSSRSFVHDRQLVCVHFDLALQPSHCGLFPPEEVWFALPYTLANGYHTIAFAKPRANESSETDPSSLHLLAARHFWVFTPTVELKSMRLQESGTSVFLNLQIQTTAFDLQDLESRVCALVDDLLECFQPSRLLIEQDDESSHQRTSLFRAPLFSVGPGRHTLTLLLVNSVNKCFASSLPQELNVELRPEVGLVPRDTAFFLEPPLAAHVPRPVQCSHEIAASGLAWICDLWRHEWGRFSQNGEDGILQSIFHNVGVTDHKFYVEFGTEDASECNTRYLWDVLQWTGLLMDGSHANARINLHKEWISPENINALFTKYDVPADFDLLSVDVDFNDYWILDAIDRTRFSPRVIAIEINSHIPPQEARVVMYQGAAARWDGKSLYFGVSVGAVHLWGVRNGYSLVYCESRGVNCFLVRNDVLASVTTEGYESLVVSEQLRAEELHAPPNFFGKGLKYPPPTRESGVVEEWVWLDELDRARVE